MKHRGEIIEKAVRSRGIPINRIAKQLHKSRQYVYNLFENPSVPIDAILLISKIIHYDFSLEFKDLVIPVKKQKEINTANVFNETEQRYENAEYWKNKYLELLEKYNLQLQQMVGNKTSKKKIKK